MKLNAKIVWLITTIYLLNNSVYVYARILTVNGITRPLISQFTSLQDAVDFAQNGDTIYLYPCLTKYSGAKISKKVTIIGTGFDMVNDYSNLSQIKSNDTIIFENNSTGSVLESVTGFFNVKIIENNIIVQKCKISTISILPDKSNIIIKNCYVNNANIYRGSEAAIYNNIIDNVYADLEAIVIVKNNIFTGSQYNNFINAKDAYQMIMYNNIFISYYGSFWHNDFYAFNYLPPNNINSHNSVVQPNDYQWFVDISKNYNLLNDSPGKNAGNDGTDLGIYGGFFPFIDDGAPSIPIIYQLNVPNEVIQKDGLQVIIKAKTN